MRRQLGELRVALVRAGAPDDEQKALGRSITQLDELFLLVVVGEFNAGKSAVINALLGEQVLEEGVTPDDLEDRAPQARRGAHAHAVRGRLRGDHAPRRRSCAR